MHKKITRSIYISESESQFIEKIAKKNDVSFNLVIRKIIQDSAQATRFKVNQEKKIKVK